DAYHGLAGADLLDVAAERLVEDLHRQLAGDLPGRRAAHAVGDGQERDVAALQRELPDAVVVLVERPDPTYVRAVADVLTQPHAGSLTRWTPHRSVEFPAGTEAGDQRCGRQAEGGGDQSQRLRRRGGEALEPHVGH